MFRYNLTVTNILFYNFLAYGTARNMGIGTKLYGTVCTYTQSGDVAPLLYHYRLYSQPSPCRGLAPGKLSR